MGICRTKALISAPLPRVWDFIIDPRNLHRWGPATEPVTDIDRPLQAGDRLTFKRTDFFRRYSQMLLVEEVVPYRSIRLRDLLPDGGKRDVTATVSVEEAADLGTTWTEEAISYSLGDSRVVQWVDRWLVNPVFNVLVRWKGKRVLRRLADVLAQGHAGGESAGGPRESRA
jgi:uncharacterized protein YndB with AHSA1/START domain